MEDDDVQAVEISEDKLEEEISEEKPIMSLFQRLISSDNKQNTVLTNAQIKDILKKEFDIETSDLHELEEDIYLNIMKKFLKDWPQWDEFDRTIVSLKLKGDQVGLKTILQIKYKSLRKYLRLMLNLAEPVARKHLEGIEIEANSTKNQKPNNLDDIVLEVHCNRAQLNKLFFRHPHPDQNRTVFNIDDSGPSRITVTKPTIEGILNSFGICVQLSIHSVTITRFTCHELNHVLVNRKLKIPRESHNKLKNSIQMHALTKPSTYTKKNILDRVTETYERFVKKGYSEAVTVLRVLMQDLAEGPENFRVPARYRKYMSKYTYKRILNAELPEDIESKDEKYDLQLEETIKPRYQYTVHKFGTSKEKMYTLQIECSQCGTKYKGYNMLNELEQHYLGFHSHEPDVTCSNCNESFSVDYLTAKRWHHSCQKRSLLRSNLVN